LTSYATISLSIITLFLGGSYEQFTRTDLYRKI